MENQSKLGKYLAKRTIKEIFIVPSTPLTKPEVIHTPLIKFGFFFLSVSLLFFCSTTSIFVAFSKFQPLQPFSILAIHFFFHTLVKQSNIMRIISFEQTFYLNVNFHQSIFSKCKGKFMVFFFFCLSSLEWEWFM